MLRHLWSIDHQTGARARAHREHAIEQVLAIFRGRGASGHRTGNSPGCKWVAFNAIAEHLDYGRRYTARSNQVHRSFEDTSLEQRAFELVRQRELGPVKEADHRAGHLLRRRTTSPRPEGPRSKALVPHAGAARLCSARNSSPTSYGSSSAAGQVGVARTGLRIVGAMQPSAARGKTAEYVAKLA